MTYALSVNNIRDRVSQPNTIAPDTTVNFSFFATARVTRGLQVLDNFRERSDTTIHDVSGVGTPLNLNIEQRDRASWLPDGGLTVLQEARILSVGPTTQLNEVCMASNELTVEVWVNPANVEPQSWRRGPVIASRNVNRRSATRRLHSRRKRRFGPNPRCRHPLRPQCRGPCAAP